MTENHAQGTPLFDTVLVANRGEIAVRVIRTLRRLGIRSVAVHSDADADARHVREADTAVRLGPAPARESYLDIDAVVDAARRTGAQAVHPGYGFLSENADFARALDAAGIVFVGPPVGSLDAMADKIRAKETVAAYDVPVVPGIQDPTLTDEQITAEAERVGFPLLIKPSAGGGGKGMVAVRAAEELPGDDRLLAALEVADAGDVLTSLDRGLAGMITEKGRSLSGGQRQRVALARALLTEAPALVLIEPTSALDSHTESRVARRLHAARRGRTTIVATESPLVLEACDEVVLLGDDGERARSTHRELLARAREGDPDALAYRAVVARAYGEQPDDGGAGCGPDGDGEPAVPSEPAVPDAATAAGAARS